MRLSITVEVEVADDDLEPGAVIAHYVVVEREDQGDGLTMWEVDNFTVEAVDEATER